MPQRTVEPDIPWLASRTFWIIASTALGALLAGAGIKSLSVLLRKATPAQAFLYGQSSLTPGLPASFRVMVRDEREGTPLKDAVVDVALVSKSGRRLRISKVRTDADGMAQAEARLPEDLAEGDYTVAVQADSLKGPSEVSRPVSVKRSFRLLVTTDKPLYQPGQTIHIRALALAVADGLPAAGQGLVLEVRDSKGNKVFKRPTKTSEFGIAAADFELADQVNTGDYAVSAALGDTTSEKSVGVRTYALPKFKVELSADKGYYLPGSEVRADLSARYTFGKPVAGADVLLEAVEFVERFHTFAQARGTTDGEGRYHASLPLKDFFVGQGLKKGDAVVQLVATVKDPAGNSLAKTIELPVTGSALRIELFPESGELVRDVENILYVVTAYPDGRPAKAKVALGEPIGKTVETSALGLAKVRFTPRDAHVRVAVTAEDPRGLKAEELVPLTVGPDASGLLLRADRPVYRAGETAQLEVLSPAKTARVFVDVVKDRRTTAMRALDVVGGRGALSLDLTDELAGTLELHAYRILASGEMVRDSRLIQVDKADALRVRMTLDKSTYRPGAKALLKFLVESKAGKPVPAALSLAGVDEAVFALSDMQPGLEAVYFAVQEELLKPRYELHARMPAGKPELLNPGQDAGVRDATAAVLAAAKGGEAPKADSDKGFADRELRIREQKSDYFKKLSSAGCWLLLSLFVLSALPLVAYSVLRLFVRTPLQAQPGEVAAFDRAAGSLLRRWFAGIFAPPLAAAGGAALGPLLHLYEMTESLAFSAGCAAVLGAFAALVLASRRLLACEASAAVPWMRKAVRMAPWAYLLAQLAEASALQAASMNALEPGSVALRLLAVFAVMAVCCGALSVARNCAVRATTRLGWAWLMASRSVCGALPLLLLLTAVVASRSMGMISGAGMGVANQLFVAKAAGFGGGAMPRFAARGGLEMAALEAAPVALDFMQADMPAAATTGAAGSAAAPKLKAPERIRNYFPETLFWRPELITDASGKAQLELPLADSITTWRVAASAVSRAGELGAATEGLRVFQDFFVDIDFPAVLTQNDEVSVPVSVFNYLDKPQTVRLEVEGASWCELLSERTRELRLGPKEVTGLPLKLRAKVPGKHALTLKASGTEMADAVRREVRVEPDGQAVVQTINGRLDERRAHELVVPEDAIDGATDLHVKVYPGAFSQVMEGLDGLFQMPYGCFEQTSSVNYPNVLVLDYLRRTKQAKPTVEMKALGFINQGYQRLLSYEVKGGGFSWFGNPPAHNVLTAYGLLEFSDMAKVTEVDPAVISRTKDWLYAQQKGNGSWEPTSGGIAEGAINQYEGSAFKTTAYIAWALAEADEKASGLDNALSYIAEGWRKYSDDPYTLALCANALVAAGRRVPGRDRRVPGRDRRGDAAPILERLDSMKVADGKTVHWRASSGGATFSMGDSLVAEATAIAAQAMLASGSHTGTAHKALAWLVEHKDPRGTWNGTQSTVAAMRALLAGAGPSGMLDKRTKVAIAVNGKPVRELDISPETSDVFRLVDLKPLAAKGKTTVSLESSGGGGLAYQIVSTHYVPWSGPKAEAAKPLRIEVHYDRTRLRKDDILTARVALRYGGPGAARMTMVDLGVPPGFDVENDSLQKLKDSRLIERYSMTGRQVTLYFDTIPAGRAVEFAYRLRARFPVKAKSPGARAYQYYQPEVKDETEPVELNVDL